MGAARIVGISRSGKARADVYDEMHPIADLDAVLPKTTILVMALPGTAETAGILSRERIALLPSDAIVINVGRGTAIDQPALVEALNSGAIAGAALDVMVPEPLPQDDPLWDAKNLVLTPHTSGNLTLGHTCDSNVDMFCEDLANYGRRPAAAPSGGPQPGLLIPFSTLFFRKKGSVHGSVRILLPHALCLR